MYQKQCRLTLADKFYKGGGAPQIPQRDPGAEWQDLKGFFKGSENQFEGFSNRDPTLNMLFKGAQDYFKSPTSPLLSSLQSGALGLMGGDQSALLQSLNQRALTQDPLLKSMNLRAMNMGPSALLTDLTGQARSDLALGGNISAQEEHDRQQQLLAARAGQGNLAGPQWTAEDLLNRDKYGRERQAERRAFAGGIEQLGQSQTAEQNRYGLGVEGANQAFNQFGLGTQGANIQDIQNRYGLAEDVQKLSNQDIAQRYQIPQSVFQTGIAGYTGLTDPIYKYFGDLFSSNQNAAGAQAVAGANNKAGQTTGAIGTIGSVIGAVAMAY